jgi:ABC-type branched-subunit amino acid transport system substrate-binding protein
MNKKVIWLALALIVLIGGWYLFNNKKVVKPAEKEKTLKIAVNVPLTGPISAWSGQFPNGFNMGIEDACKKYNVDPKNIIIDYQDNQGNSKNSVMAFQKQKINLYDLLISVSTIPVNAYGTEADKIDKPHFIASFDPFITQNNDNRFRVMANSKIEAPLFIEYAIKKQAKKVFILQLNLSYAEEEFGRIIIPELSAKGISSKRELYDISERDFKNLAAKIKAYKPDLIFICGYSFHVQPIIKDLRSANLVKKGNVLSVMDFVDLTYSDAPYEELKDIAFVCPNFDIPNKISSMIDWRGRYFTKFNIKPTYVPAYAYDNALLIVKTFAENSGIVDKATLLKSLPFEGINGLINMDAERDILSTVSLAMLNDQGVIEELKY